MVFRTSEVNKARQGDVCFFCCSGVSSWRTRWSSRSSLAVVPQSSHGCASRRSRQQSSISHLITCGCGTGTGTLNPLYAVFLAAHRLLLWSTSYIWSEIVIFCVSLGCVFFGCVLTNSSCTEQVGSAGTSHGLVDTCRSFLSLEKWDPLIL